MSLASSAPLVRFYTRAGCSLCERAYPILQRLAAEGALRVEVVDIAADAALDAALGTQIPVVELPDGRRLAGRISEFRMRRLLENRE